MSESEKHTRRPPLDEDEHEALDLLSSALERVVDHRAHPELLIEAAKRVLRSFGEEWD